MNKCPVCNGEGWLRREIDTSAMYGKPHMSTVTRICPNCLGKRYAPPLPVDGKSCAAQDSETFFE